MKEKSLKAPDLARLAGISGTEMKRIAEQYDSVIPSRLLGRVKLYEQRAAGIVEKISSMEAAGTAPGDIIREFGGKVTRKSTREKTEEKIRKNASTGDGGKRRAPSGESARPAPMASGALRGNEEKNAFLELKLTRLTDRVEKLEKQLESEKNGREKDREEFRKVIAGISEKLEVTGEWVGYFDRELDDFSAGQNEFNTGTREWIDYTEKEIDRLGRPFWKRGG